MAIRDVVGGSYLDRHLWAISFVSAVLQEELDKVRRVYAAYCIVALQLRCSAFLSALYALGWLFGIWLQEGVLWGHALGQYIGL